MLHKPTNLGEKCFISVKTSNKNSNKIYEAAEQNLVQKKIMKKYLKAMGSKGWEIIKRNFQKQYFLSKLTSTNDVEQTCKQFLNT